METVKSQREAAFWTIAELRNQSRRPGPDEIAVSLDMVDSGSGRLNADSSTYDSEGTVFTANDVLYGKLRPYLQKYWHADRDGVAIGDIYVFGATDLSDPRFLFYVVAQPAFSKWGEITSTGVKMPRTNWASLRDYRITLPSLDTQRRIADYLDTETAQIDAMMAKLDEQVELLRERRKAVISKILGALAEEYPARSLALLVSSEDHRRIPVKAEDRSKMSGNVPYFGASGVIDYVDKPLWSNEGERLLISEDGANLVMRNHPISFVVTGEFWVNNHAHVLKPHTGIPAKLLVYAIENTSIIHLISGSAQPKLTAAALDRIHLSIPDSPEECNRQLAELDEKTARIDTMITKCEELKTLLQERRAALITAVVTGQEEVPSHD